MSCDQRALFVITAALVAVPHAALGVGSPKSVIPHPEGTLTLVSPRLNPGSVIEVSGANFGADGNLELVLVGVTGRVPLDTVRTNDSGSFTDSVMVPVTLKSGTYRLVAIASDGDEVASMSVEILPEVVRAGLEGVGEVAAHVMDERSEPVAEDLPLDRAGSPLVTGSALAGVLAALLGGILLVRRRRVA